MTANIKSRIGVVVSDKMDKTVVVAVETPKHHDLYKKTIRRITKYKAHDGKNEARRADLVRIVETRPLSKDKRWRVAEIIKKGELVVVSPEEIQKEELQRTEAKADDTE
jgi:small subunit ribosomal protein S17